jgi:hypothetical protein
VWGSLAAGGRVRSLRRRRAGTQPPRRGGRGFTVQGVRSGLRRARKRQGKQKERIEPVIFHLLMAVMGNLPQLHKIWIWWSTS